MSQTRQLAAIMFTDIVGYTALMGNDEQKAFVVLNKNRNLQKPIIEQCNGRCIKELGDGIMASFSTVSDAVNAAIKIQDDCNAAEDFQLRVGIHLGDIVFENDDVFGDGVNIASRIQAVAEPGCIYISESVQRNISNKKGITTKFIKEEVLKNVKEPVRMYEVSTLTDTNFLTENKIRTVSNKSIAVLPFVNMSNDPEQEYFGEGIAEEILNSLTHLRDLKVASRTSSFQFKEKNIDLQEIWNKLGVTNVLEGSVRKQGNKLRITAQLTSVTDGFNLWSERYDRELDNIFAIQDEIALAITEKLKVTLFENDLEKITKMHTQNTEAYQLYLQGRYFWNRRTNEGLKLSVDYFQKAIEKDPNYAIPWVGLADSYNLLREYGNNSSTEMYPKAKLAVSRALEIDNHLCEAHVSLASLMMLDEWDWVNSGREFKLGMDLNPNYATAHHWYSEWLMYQGRFEESFAEISKAIDLDPISMGIIKDKGLVFYYSRQYEKAITWAKSALELDPKFASLHRLLSLSYQGKKWFDYAIKENKIWGDLTKNHFKTKAALAHIYTVSGRKKEAGKILESITEDEAKIGNDYKALAIIYGDLGNYDMGFELLGKSFEKRETSLLSMKIDPKLDALRSDPRFNILLNKVGL